jgi:hypothetical protein
MKTNRFFVFGLTAVLLVLGLVLAVVPVFAEEPMTISGAWLREGHTLGTMAGKDSGEKLYYYFSPGGADGTAVGVAVVPDVLGGEQIMPFTGTWDFEVKDGKQLFCVYRIRVMAPGTDRFVGGGTTMPGQAQYRFYTENGTPKMELFLDSVCL